jgi:hypothetical protein
VTSSQNPFGTPEGGNPQWERPPAPHASSGRTPAVAPPSTPQPRRHEPAFTGRPAAGRPQSGRGVASLLCGIGGLFLLPLVLSVPAIVLGVSARRQVDASGGVIGGRNLATVGLWLGVIGVLWWGLIFALVAIGMAANVAT